MIAATARLDEVDKKGPKSDPCGNGNPFFRNLWAASLLIWRKKLYKFLYIGDTTSKDACTQRQSHRYKKETLQNTIKLQSETKAIVLQTIAKKW